jgi:hypothetical protein
MEYACFISRIFKLKSPQTTSSSTAWALHALSENTAVQSKLREELLTLSTDNPTMDELNSLPYLEHVVRETMVRGFFGFSCDLVEMIGIKAGPCTSRIHSEDGHGRRCFAPLHTIYRQRGESAPQSPVSIPLEHLTLSVQCLIVV